MKLKEHHVWTNIFYLIGGLIVAPFNLLGGISMLYLGIASGIAHYHGGKWWALDWSAMFFLFTAIITAHFGMWYLALPAIALPYIFPKTMENFYTIGGLYVGAVATLPLPEAFFTMIIMGVGFAFRQFHFGMHENDAHAVWHFFTALGITLMLL
jgi:hypothetical protein